jgi:multiple sugar transport system ATP-binding protein
VLLGIRPEHVMRAAAGQGRDAPLLTAVTEVVEPTGAETIALLRTGDHAFTARFAPSAAPNTGETVRLLVDMEKACLFDAKTEVLIS